MQHTNYYVLNASKQKPSLKDWADLRNKLNDPAVLAKDQEAQAFLDRAVFDGLIDLRPTFDSPVIKHFECSDFGAVIERCTLHNVLVIGIEVFTPQAELLDVEIAPEESCSNAWCVEFLKRFGNRPGLTYCATYDVTSKI